MTQAHSNVPPVGGIDVVDPQDRTHLTLLTVFWYIWAGMCAIGVCAGAFYIFLGLAMIGTSTTGGGGGQTNADAAAGYIFAIVGGALTVLMLAIAVLAAMSAYGISKRKWKVLTYIMAALACLSIPLGTALGIYTFIALSRPGIQALYERQAAPM